MLTRCKKTVSHSKKAMKICSRHCRR